MSSLKQDLPPKTPYWRSLAELSQDGDVSKHLAEAYADVPLEGPGAFSRRRFMQLMGASFALGSGSACRWEKANLLAFTRRPAGHIDGKPKHFATMMELNGAAMGLSVVSFDGRPIKIEGNPRHPVSRGKSTAFAQASILEMYDPDRSQQPVRSGPHGQLGAASSWSDFVAWLTPIQHQHKSQHGRGLVVLSESSSSPTVARLRDRLIVEMPEAKFVEYEPISRDNERLGVQRVFGQALRPLYHLKEAAIIVSLDDELLVEHPNALVYAQDFAHSRKPDKGTMSRLYAAESRFSLTGGMADHRLAVRSEHIGALAWGILAEVVRQGSLAAAQDLQLLAEASPPPLLDEAPVKAFVQAIAHDLRAHMGQSLLTAGAGQPPEVHTLVHQLNVLLGNVGHTVSYVPAPESNRAPHHEAITRLCQQMHDARVTTLVILGGNPGLDAPINADFVAAMAKVPNTVHLGVYNDETSQACSWHLPRSHFLESWGDGRAYDGTISMCQPLIEPLYKSKSHIELISLLLGEDVPGERLVHETFVAMGGSGDVTTRWRQALHDGFVAQSNYADVAPTRRPVDSSLRAALLGNTAQGASIDGASMELTFWPDSHTWDGRFANNGWLQELPDFMTKLTWDNALYVAPKTAEALGIKHQYMVNVTVGSRTLSLPAYVMPGQSEGSVATTLGYGRVCAGHVAGLQKGNVTSAGFDTYVLKEGQATNFVGGVKLTPTSTFFELGITQDHHSLDATAQKGRDERVPEIVREANLKTFNETPSFAKHVVEHPPLKSLWQEFSYDGHRWGLGIDLNSCIGCNACVVACQAENNIPVVGKEQVINGREMHWIRIDRYFSGDASAPQVVHQPMACQQCEMAPCESVCPVAATVHSHEGLNDMVYNRCVGTRYCSNNCPYKVRRFNFFNYHKSLEKSENQVAKMVYNPEVTVRARGVMEKCTYCVQRIKAVTIPARNKRRPIKDGEIVPACAQACPASAIVFGDLNDASSEVAAWHANARSYAVLEELNTKPRTAYLARVRNPNSAMERAQAQSIGGAAHTAPAQKEG